MTAKPVTNKNIMLKNGFWKEMAELVKNEVISYQWNALNDNIENAEKSYCIRNFKLAGDIIEKRRNGIETPVYHTDKWFYTSKNSDKNSFLGWVFQDSDLAKWIEAVAYCLESEPDSELERLADNAIDLVCRAQAENGYLNTLYTINNPEKAFTNLKDRHEFYCFGHFAEAGVAYYNATGKDKLLNAVIKYADLICDTFGEQKKEGYGGHEIAEMAFIKLYHATKNQKYINMAKLLIDRRGTKPYYFDLEQGIEPDEKIRYEYNQAHIPAAEQKEAVGHAVRAVYLYSGMADVARETNNTELLNTCKELFKNITSKKMYITGGIGSTKDGEAFTFDYDLPNDLAYAESCASIGLVFFAQRMLISDINSKYADIIEKCLCNGIISGIAPDGKSFFYVNPLEVNPIACKKDSRKDHIKPVRQKWFNCACCPPNIARLIASVGEYCVTENENTVFIHQYINMKVECKNVDLEIDETYIKNGKVKITVNTEKPINIALRLPCWCSNYKFSIKPCKTENGYAYFRIDKNSEILAEFKPEIKIMKCNPKVRSNIGKVAIMRGPIVYCLEEADNGADLHLLSLAKSPDFSYHNSVITANGFKEAITDDLLYKEYSEPEEQSVQLTFIPYYKWARRGENEMCVYIRF